MLSCTSMLLDYAYPFRAAHIHTSKALLARLPLTPVGHQPRRPKYCQKSEKGILLQEALRKLYTHAMRVNFYTPRTFQRNCTRNRFKRVPSFLADIKRGLNSFGTSRNLITIELASPGEMDYAFPFGPLLIQTGNYHQRFPLHAPYQPSCCCHQSSSLFPLPLLLPLLEGG